MGSRPPLICLFGPTAVGKSDLLIKAFASVCEVVSVDSVQVYRGLDIGSAKPSLQERQIIPHHLIDIRDPQQTFDVGDFCLEAEKACQDIWSRGRIPILSGGTAYYFKHFLFGLPEAPGSDPQTRQQVEELFNSLGEDGFRELLRQVDPVSWQKLGARDYYRLRRAYEVYVTSGRPLSSFSPLSKARDDVSILLIGLNRDREELYSRIDQRVDLMMQKGLLQEVQHLLDQGFTAADPALRAIGYAEFIPYLTTGEGDLKLIVDLIKQSSRRYSKRQLTFFRSLPDVHWFHPDNWAGIQEILAKFDPRFE